MVAMRLDRLGRVHWRYMRGAVPDERGREQVADALGCQDGDNVFLIWERDAHAGCTTSARVEHYVAVVPREVRLVKQSDGPLEVEDV